MKVGQMFAIVLMSAGTLLVPARRARAQNLITNPGFETAPAAGGDHLQGSGAGTAWYANSFAGGPTQTIQNWTFGYDGTVATTGASAAQVEWYKSGSAYTWNAIPAHGGTYAVELNTDAQKGRMYAQPTLTSNLTIGKTYTLTFWVAPENHWPTGTGITSITGQVTINGTSVLTYTLNAPTGLTTATWTQESVTFVAGTTAPQIRFWDGTYVGANSTNYSSAVGGSNDISLDDISLTQTTPEPTIVGAAGLLVLMIGWMERRRVKAVWRNLRPFFYRSICFLACWIIWSSSGR